MSVYKAHETMQVAILCADDSIILFKQLTES